MRLRYLLIFFLLLPFVDLYILVEVASEIGFLETVALVVLTGLIGAEMIRREGRFVARKLNNSVTAEEMSRNFLEALLLLVAGLMLLSPGLVTDVLGALTAVRPVRERLAFRLSRKIKEKGSFQFQFSTF